MSAIETMEATVNMHGGNPPWIATLFWMEGSEASIEQRHFVSAILLLQDWGQRTYATLVINLWNWKNDPHNFTEEGGLFLRKLHLYEKRKIKILDLK